MGVEIAQGLGAIATGNDFMDPETGYNSDGSPRTRSGFQDNDLNLNDEGYLRGLRDAKRDAKRQKDCDKDQPDFLKKLRAKDLSV